MSIVVYIVIFVLFAVLFLWTWNNTKDFEQISIRIGFIVIGILLLSLITFIVFNISKKGVAYPNKEMIKQVRNIALLIFIPINGFFTLPHVANLYSDIMSGGDETTKRKMIILGIIFIVVLIIETIYLKSFQNGIIQILKLK